MTGGGRAVACRGASGLAAGRAMKAKSSAITGRDPLPPVTAGRMAAGELRAGARVGQGPHAGGEPSLPHPLVHENGHPRNHGGVNEFEVHSLHALAEATPALPQPALVSPHSRLIHD